MIAGIAVSYKKEGPISFLTFTGEIDQTMLQKNFSDVYNLIGDFKNIVLLLDLSAVLYINSGFIGYVSELFSNVDEGRGKMAIVGNPVINDTFDLVGFGEFVKIRNTQEEALEELKAFL